MPDRVPLPTLLSQVLVAFTIEFDNEWERRFTESRPTRRFLVSLVMWSNLMRLVGDDGVRVGDIPVLSGMPGAPVTTGSIHAMLAGMTRWGYITVAPDPTDARPKPPRADWIVRATPAGKRAQSVWRPLVGVVEERWRARFSAGEVDALRAALTALVDGLDVPLPDYLPIIGYGLRVVVPHLDTWVPTVPTVPTVPAARTDSNLGLSTLLSRALLRFTIEFERESTLALAINANALRVVSEAGVRVRDLPGLSGVSKEALAVSTGFLEREGYAEIVPDPSAARTKLVRLTAKGRAAQAADRLLVDDIEARWRTRDGADAIDRVRAALEALFDAPDGKPRLADGLAPSATGWRNRKQYRAQTEAMQHDPARALPHHPMVLHRGGWPDGS